MTQLTDLCIPRSALVFDGIDHASATAADWDTTQIGVLLQAVVQNHAASLVPADEIHTVRSRSMSRLAQPMAPKCNSLAGSIARRER